MKLQMGIVPVQVQGVRLALSQGTMGAASARSGALRWVQTVAAQAAAGLGES